MACQQIGLDLLLVGTPICLQSRLLMVLNHTRVSIPSNNLFPEALKLDLSPMVGEVAPLLLPTVHRGVRRRHQPDPLRGGEAVEVAADGVDGVVDHKWHNQHLHGMGEEAAAVVPIFGLNHHRSFLSTLEVVLPP